MNRPAATTALALPALLLTGCLERTITITSEPPGALVHLNDVELGRTPVTTEFRYFGVYDVRLAREGYEPVATARETGVPIWEYPGIDLLAILAPWRVQTSIEWEFALQPEPTPGTTEAQAMEDALLERATSLKDASRGE
ncbi:MAG: PEGA domain-containing protein [Planctomycetota bacterium]